MWSVLVSIHDTIGAIFTKIRYHINSYNTNTHIVFVRLVHSINSIQGSFALRSSASPAAETWTCRAYPFRLRVHVSTITSKCFAICEHSKHQGGGQPKSRWWHQSRAEKKNYPRRFPHPATWSTMDLILLGILMFQIQKILGIGSSSQHLVFLARWLRRCTMRCPWGLWRVEDHGGTDGNGSCVHSHKDVQTAWFEGFRMPVLWFCRPCVYCVYDI